MWKEESSTVRAKISQKLSFRNESLRLSQGFVGYNALSKYKIKTAEEEAYGWALVLGFFHGKLIYSSQVCKFNYVPDFLYWYKCHGSREGSGRHDWQTLPIFLSQWDELKLHYRRLCSESPYMHGFSAVWRNVRLCRQLLSWPTT